MTTLRYFVFQFASLAAAACVTPCQLSYSWNEFCSQEY